MIRLEEFEAEWGKRYPAIGQTWRRAWEHVIPFFAFAPGIRKMIYTTNAVEALHRSLRKIIKTRGASPTTMRRSSCFTSPSKMPACDGDVASNGPLPWVSLPLRSARVFQDRRDDPGGRANQPSNPVARVWPSNWPCKGWPSATAFGG